MQVDWLISQATQGGIGTKPLVEDMEAFERKLGRGIRVYELTWGCKGVSICSAAEADAKLLPGID